MVQPTQVARDQGDGSRSALEDEMNGDLWTHKDSRAETETTFWPQDIDGLDVSEQRKRDLHRALRRQEGENRGEHYTSGRVDRKGQNRKEWRRRMASVFASRLNLTKYQRQRAGYIIEEVDFSSFASYSKEQAILGVINVVAREDGRWIEDEPLFLEIAEDEGLDARDLRRLRGMVKGRL